MAPDSEALLPPQRATYRDNENLTHAQTTRPSSPGRFVSNGTLGRLRIFQLCSIKTKSAWDRGYRPSCLPNGYKSENSAWDRGSMCTSPA